MGENVYRKGEIIFVKYTQDSKEYFPRIFVEMGVGFNFGKAMCVNNREIKYYHDGTLNGDLVGWNCHRKAVQHKDEITVGDEDIYACDDEEAKVFWSSIK